MTRQLIHALRPVAPRVLFVAADGPRAHKPADAHACAEVRALIATEIDWPCTIKTLYRSENLGCGRAVSGAISWFFEHVEAGIILEDDTLPHPSFFRFCSELLERYQDQEIVKHISGNNFQLGRRRGEAGYYFSQYPHIWGWASWRRAWAGYRFQLPDLVGLPSDLQAELPMRMLREVAAGQLDTWDTQWLYHIVQSGSLCVTPQANLVKNAGFGVGTHTFEAPYYYSKMEHGESTDLSLIPPLVRDVEADLFSNALLYNLSFQHKIADKLHKLQGKVVRAVHNLTSRNQSEP